MSERKLITKLHSGNEMVFKEIFKQYYLPVRSFAQHFVKDCNVAEDIVQDSFLLVWERKLEFNAFAEIRKYLYTTIRNACLDYLKHIHVTQKHETYIRAFMTEEEEKEYILEDEVDSLIYQAIGSLSKQAREIVIMTMNGASNLEIAQTLNTTINTVKSTKLKAYRVLRKRLRNIQWFLALLLT